MQSRNYANDDDTSSSSAKIYFIITTKEKKKKKAVPKSEKRPIPNPRTEEADNHPLEEALVMEAGYPRTFPCSLSPQHLQIRTMTKLSCKISN